MASQRPPKGFNELTLQALEHLVVEMFGKFLRHTIPITIGTRILEFQQGLDINADGPRRCLA